MNRIEEIRDETETSDSYRKWFDVEWNNRGKGAVDELIQHNEKLSANVQYLLAKLEQAEKELELFADDDSWLYDDRSNLPIVFDFNKSADPGEVAKDALRAIRS